MNQQPSQWLGTLQASMQPLRQSWRSTTETDQELAPAYALLSTREARGEYAQKAIGRAQDEFCAVVGGKITSGPSQQCKYFFSLGPATVPLPLGWMLSNGAAEAMQQEMYDSGLSKKAPVPTWNKAMLEQIVVSLGGQIP